MHILQIETSPIKICNSYFSKIKDLEHWTRITVHSNLLESSSSFSSSSHLYLFHTVSLTSDLHNLYSSEYGTRGLHTT